MEPYHGSPLVLYHTSILAADRRFGADAFKRPCRILGFEGGKPLDVVVAQDPENRICIVVTVYKPDPKLWSDDFRTRR
ncbi:MAG: hypothetical protein KatS3mg110_0887 [Pirellulaceae bacterium]|nr:MAG: hypothetical protein KatS3mg110_0887 [Pirellulaceae bacterium]